MQLKAGEVGGGGGGGEGAKRQRASPTFHTRRVTRGGQWHGESMVRFFLFRVHCLLHLLLLLFSSKS